MTAPTAERPLILPPLRRTAYDAYNFAYVAHRGQVDKAGRPYLSHLTRVHARVTLVYGGDDDAQQMAWLHDVIEDTPYTINDLAAEDFSDEVLAGVDMLTRDDPHEPYLNWIGRIAERASLPVILVKIADIEDNSDPERLALLDEPTRERLKKKYGDALPILKEAAERLTAKDKGETR